MARLSRPGWLWLNTKMVYLRTVTHPSTNRVRRRATTLIKTNALPLSQAATLSDGQNINNTSYLFSRGQHWWAFPAAFPDFVILMMWLIFWVIKMFACLLATHIATAGCQWRRLFTSNSRRSVIALGHVPRAVRVVQAWGDLWQLAY